MDGDLRGRGVWTLSPPDGKVHVRFDTHVFADRALLRVLTPVLRPLFRWNNNVAIKAAMKGLETFESLCLNRRRRGECAPVRA